ncbi:MAG: tetratricopeptide repeat protein [archaeon]|nr:tetratricopeptide repeat protein [archaeon]
MIEDDEGTSSCQEFLQVPINFTHSVVGVRLDEFPSNLDLINALQGEYAPLKAWLQCAIGYYRLGQFDHFLTIMEAVTDAVEQIDVYKDSRDERVALMNVLAAYYSQLAASHPSQSEREKYRQQTNKLCNDANRLQDHDDSTSVIMSGLHLLRTGVDDTALDYFNRFLAHVQKNNRVLQNSRNPGTIPALVGKLCLLYHKGHYAQAFELACTVFQIHPNPPPSFRLPFAYIHFKLGNFDLSRKAFERVLQLDPDNIEALLGLSVHELNHTPAPRLDAATGFLLRAYRVNPYHPGVLLKLADLLILSKQYQAAEEHAYRVLDVSDDPHCLAEANRMLGVVAIQRGGDEGHRAAFGFFSESRSLMPENNPVANLGLGQIYFFRSQWDEATQCFSNVLRIPAHANSAEAHLYLGRIKVWQDRPAEAVAHFRKVLEIQPTNLTACNHYAQLIQSDDPAAALETYLRASNALQKKGKVVPTTIHNNIGVLYFASRDYDNALLRFANALCFDGKQFFSSSSSSSSSSTCESSISTLESSTTTSSSNVVEMVVDPSMLSSLEERISEHTTIIFNIARIFEERKLLDAATSLYEGIVREHPSFIAAEIRLACVKQARGDADGAIAMFRQLVEKDPRNLEVWCLWANLYLSQGKYSTAQQLLEQVLKFEADDPYVNLVLGNIQYQALFLNSSRTEKALGYAYAFYSRVLHRNPKNLYAANGLGLLMVQHGYMTQALDIFLQVRDAKPEFPDVWLNLGHVYFSQKQYSNALQMYRTCLERFYQGKNADVLHFIARAHYEQSAFAEAASSLSQAIELSSDVTLVYNRAIVDGDHGIAVLKRDFKTTEDVQAAILRLREAAQALQALAIEKEGKEQKYSPKAASIRSKYYAKTADRATHIMDQVRESEEKEKETRVQQEAEKRRVEEEAARLQRAHEEEEAARALQEKEEYEAYIAKIDPARKEFEAAKESKKKTSSAASSSRPTQEDDDDAPRTKRGSSKAKAAADEGQSDEQEATPKTRKRAARPKSSALLDESSDDGEFIQKRLRKPSSNTTINDEEQSEEDE